MLLYFSSILAAAFLWANLEIQIEGAQGWAGNLPTWRVEKHFLLHVFYGGRPLTGYHLWSYCSVLLFLHLPFVVMHSWSLRLERQVIAAYTLFWLIEDCLWFLLNPHFGWKRFSREQVWWHKRWFLGLPLDYWIMSSFAALLLLV